MLTVEEFAEQMGMGRTLAYAEVAARRVESVKVGRLRRIPVDARDRYVQRLLDEQSREAA